MIYVPPALDAVDFALSTFTPAELYEVNFDIGISVSPPSSYDIIITIEGKPLKRLSGNIYMEI